MLSGALEGRFEKRARSRPIAYAAEIGDDGLVLGAGTILARMTRDSLGAPALDLEDDEDRLDALLAAAHGRPMSPDLPRHLDEAFAHWRRGEKALANIRLAFARIPQLDDRSDAYRLFLAEELLDAGMSPAALMKGLGFDAPARGLAKYDPNQPRVPAGSGRSSGRWVGRRRGASARAATSIPAPPPPPCPPRARWELWRKACSLRRKAARFSLASKHWRRRGRPRRDAWGDIRSDPGRRRFAWRDSGRAGPFLFVRRTRGMLRLYRDDETG